MKELSEAIENLLWFFYRVFLTLIPAAFFVVAALLLTQKYFPDFFSIELPGQLWETLKINAAVFIFIAAFIVNIIIEGLFHFMNNYLLDYGGLAKSIVTKKYDAYMHLIDKDVKSSLGIDGFISHRGNFFNLLKFRIAEQNQGYNNLFWYLISKEYLFNNLLIAICLLMFFFLPAGIMHDTNSKGYLSVLLLVQGMLLLLFLTSSQHFLRKKYKLEKKHKAFLALPRYYYWFYLFFFAGISLKAIAPFFPGFISDLFVLTGINLALYPLLFSLLSRGFKEFLQVEEAMIDAFINIKYSKEIYSHDKK